MSNRTRTAIRDPRRDEKRRAWLIRGVATAVVVVVAVGIGIWLIASRDDSSASDASPSVATDAGYYRVSGGATPKVTLSITEDFQCPACRQFESSFGSTVEQIRGMAGVAVEYRPVAILDRSSTTRYSTRSASASACVAEATAREGNWTVWQKFHDALYAQQPPEGGSGLTDQQLAAVARDAGAGDVGTCVEDERYGGWVGSITQKANQNGLQGTPQVEVNGKVIQLSTPQALMDSIAAATRN